jgi:alpha-galactosidase/6-phospho-beta-glucosidase family protein
MPKIVIIGGGSYSWGPTFMRDIFGTPELVGSTIVLQDIVQDRVDLVYALGQKMIQDFNLDFRLEKTLSLDEALQGADFVILTITTGRLESMRPDLEIPAKYGIKQSVGDTTGPGGLSRALRNIPVVAEIGRKVIEICPNALFLNYTNPMTVLTRVLAMQGVRVVGLCHEWIGVREHLAQVFETKPENITAKIAGVNHLIWVTDLYADGKQVFDALPAITEQVLNDKLKVDADDASVFADHAKVKSTLYQLYGALPAAGDRHIAEFFPHFINESTNWGGDYDLILTSVADRYAMEAEAKGLIESALRGAVLLEPFMQDVSTEAANKIIRAVTCGEKYVGIMNLPNVGQIANLSHDAVVETYGVIDALGANAITYGDVPTGVQNILEHHIHQQELTVTATMQGNREIALQVLLNDPLSSRLTISQAQQLLHELLEANQAYLPLFFDK